MKIRNKSGAHSTNQNQKEKQLNKNKVSETLIPSVKSNASEGLKNIFNIETKLMFQINNPKPVEEGTELNTNEHLKPNSYNPWGYLKLTREGKIIELNNSALQILGKKYSELSGNLIGFFISENSKPIFNQFLEDIFIKRINASCELNLLQARDTLKYVYVTGNIARNEDQCIAVLTDLTEHDHIKKEYIDSELKFRTYIEFAPHGVFVANESGEYIEVNSSACKITGYSKKELLSLKFIDLTPQESIIDAVNHFNKVNKEGFASGILPLIKKDKSKGYWAVDAVKITDELFLGFAVDYTERQKAEEALKESEKQYQSLFEESNDAIFLTDLTSGKYIDCNRLAKKLTGYSHEEITKMKAGSLLAPNRKEELSTYLNDLLSGKTVQNETQIKTKEGKLIPVEFNASIITINNSQCILSLLHDISKRKKAEEELKQSEERIRIKLQSILMPEGNIADLELKDIIDIESIQKLLDSFYEFAQIPMAIMDINGKVLVGIGWQEICTKFHRVHPKACRNCFESDVHLTQSIPDGEFKLYKCKNNMWDMATPINIGGEHMGNLFIGQFFFDDQRVDEELFRKQAKKFNFDEQDYLLALSQVPRINKKKLDSAKEFFLNLARTISKLSYSNIKLARSFEQQKKVENKLREKDELLNKAQEIAHIGSWSLDLNTNILTWSDEMYRIFDVLPSEFAASYEGFLELVHPNDREKVNAAYIGSILENKDSYEVEHRIINKHTKELRIVLEKCEHVRDKSHKIIRSVGMTHDITELKLSRDALIEKEELFRESQDAAKIGSYSYDLILKTWKATPALYELFGIDKIYPITLNGWLQCVHPDFRKEIIDNFIQKENHNSSFEREYKIIRANDFAERWVSGHGKYEYDNNGNPIKLIGTIQDITKRKQAEEELKQLNRELDQRVKERTSELSMSNIALQKAEEKYRTIADYNYNWETWLNNDGRYIYVSPSCFRITGYTANEFIENPELFFNIIHPEDREKVQKHFNSQHLKETHEVSLDFRVFSFDGEEKWISHNCHPVFDREGNCLGQRASNSDITQRKEVERSQIESQNQLRALTKHINELTENERKYIAREIHDELGHLLTALKYDIDSLIFNSELSIELVRSELPEMVTMVESLIDSVRKIATELRPGILDHLGLFAAIEWQIRQFRAMTRMEVRYEHRDLNFTFDKDETITIFRILQEVMTNVARHSQANTVDINLEKNGSDFIMKIADNGVGFDTTDQVKYNSLGLTGIRERALAINGKIKFESTPGKGTTVTFLLTKE